MIKKELAHVRRLAPGSKRSQSSQDLHVSSPCCGKLGLARWLIRLGKEDPGPVADHALPRAGSVAGRAEIDCPAVQVMLPGGVQQSHNRVPPAGGSRAKGLAMELFDGLRGRLVQPARFLVRMMVAQVGADDDQSPIAVPERFQDLVHRLGIGPANQEWNDGEGAEHDLEEGKLDLERMVAIVCLIVEVHLGESKRLLDRGAVDRDASQRGQELLVAGGRQAADSWRMAGTQQDNSLDLF